MHHDVFVLTVIVVPHYWLSSLQDTFITSDIDELFWMDFLYYNSAIAGMCDLNLVT